MRDVAATKEREKYEEIWEREPYRESTSPGDQCVDFFIREIKPRLGVSILDIGCGAGRAGLEFQKRGLNAYWLDITDAGLDPAVDRRKFVCAPLWSKWADQLPDFMAYGYCCDVMEHIPPEYTMLVVDKIASACGQTWLMINNLPDSFGQLIGQQLHLSVFPYTWWRDRLRSVVDVIDARDLCGASFFLVSK